MQQRRPRRPVHGVLLLDKPQGLSSNHALQRAKGMFQAEKAGHTGTLDPMATGLLPLAFGEATKFSSMLLDADKVYETDILLGVDTDTGDADGLVVRERPLLAGADEVVAAVASFAGPIVQIPPMYSALKRDGRPLYEYARAGIEVEREGREVVIHDIQVLELALPRVRIRVHCSKGTYIRTIAMDLGEKLGCGGHLLSLRRTGIGAFGVERAMGLDVLDGLDLAGRDACLLPVDALVVEFPELRLSAQDTEHLRQGRRIRLDGGRMTGPVRAFSPDGVFLGVADLEDDGGLLVPRRLVATGQG